MKTAAVSGFFRKLWAVYASPWVIVAAYWVTIGVYFGWHWWPESDAEMEAFSFGFLMFLICAKK